MLNCTQRVSAACPPESLARALAVNDSPSLLRTSMS
jgi:hypothetical protein